MARLHFTVALLALAIAGACGGIVDRGSLHAAMLEGLDSHPTMRQVTVYDPHKSIVRWRLGPSPPRCDWRMTAHIVGDYAVDETQISMKSDNCSEYTAQHWSGTFPCVFNRGDLTTTCKGPLPVGAENGTWLLGYTIVDPENTVLPQKPPPLSRNVTATPFAAEPTLLSLAGLGLAKTVQMSGEYSGSGVIASSWYDDVLYVTLNSKDVMFSLDSKIDVSEAEKHRDVNVSWCAWTAGNRLIVDMHASWYNVSVQHPSETDDYDYIAEADAPSKRTDRKKRSPGLAAITSTLGLDLHTLILVAKVEEQINRTKTNLLAIANDTAEVSRELRDIIAATENSLVAIANDTAEVSKGLRDIIARYNASRGDTETAAVSHVDVIDRPPPPPSDAPVKHTARTIVSYSRNDIESSDVTVAGEVHRLRYAALLKSAEHEPRLCPVITLTSACAIMNVIVTDETQLRKLGGNLTAFYLRDLNRCGRKGQKYICTTGNVRGTKGLLIDVKYRSPMLNSDDPAWMELPIGPLARCAERVYHFTECETPQPPARFTGPPQNIRRGKMHKF